MKQSLASLPLSTLLLLSLSLLSSCSSFLLLQQQEQRSVRSHVARTIATTLEVSATRTTASTSASSEDATIAASASTAAADGEDALAVQKRKLLGLVRPRPTVLVDPVLADPITKQSVRITATPSSMTLFGGDAKGGRQGAVKYVIQSPTNTYEGSSDRFLNLLEPVTKEEDGNIEEASASPAKESNTLVGRLINSATPFLPPPLRSVLAASGLGSDYIPMRDLFRSPAVSFAYERGWRQNFRTAGFPGPDKEFQMAVDYFQPAMQKYSETKVLVDMSCATGLFTRRFAKSGLYKRVLGCDYSDSMLEEARRRIEADPDLRSGSSSSQKTTILDLVRLDVGQIPMKDASVDALHAGAAMHCWPDLPAAVSEIYRVLQPGGRYFATTFLSTWFGALQASEGGAAAAISEPSQQAFQYFSSVEQLKSLMVSGGFAPDKVSVEVLKPACVVIRCEK